MMIKNINTGPFTVPSRTSGTVLAVVEALETTAVEIIEALSTVPSKTSGTVQSEVVEALETTAVEIIEALSTVPSKTSGTVHSEVVEALETTAISKPPPFQKTPLLKTTIHTIEQHYERK